MTKKIKYLQLTKTINTITRFLDKLISQMPKKEYYVCISKSIIIVYKFK